MSDRLERALLELAAAIREELVQAAQPAPDRLLDIPSAAAALNVGRTRLYAELDAGRLRSIRIGRRRLIPASAIAERTQQKAGRADTRPATADAATVPAVSKPGDTADGPSDPRRRRAA